MPTGLISITGLLIAIAAAGLIGLLINTRMKSITDRAIQFDIELEDRSDDFRVTVLDMRHYHRNIAFAGASRRGVADFESAYQFLTAQIEGLEELASRDATIPVGAAVRQRAEAYYAAFRPAIDLYNSDRAAFDLASDDGLRRLAELEDFARQLDHLAEQRAADALRSVERAAVIAQAVMLIVLAGLVLVGIGLAFQSARNLQRQEQVANELARALQLKSEFIADASHELRSPLTVLRANAEVALALERNCVHTELLEEIVSESERMTRLVNDLLFLASSDARSLPLDVELAEIAPFITDLAERARMLAQDRDIELHSYLQARGLATIDRTRIEQAILILVDNASKYSPAGATVNWRALNGEDDFRIEVSDSGPGIPADELPFIFERFYRVDKARNRKMGGTGLGLSIAKSIIEAHGGRIEATSELGIGTTMIVTLPLHQPVAAN
jgi:signal transduction histidine kinase